MAYHSEDKKLLAYWLKQQMQAMREKEEAYEDGKRWYKRAKLAHRSGRDELARQAQTQAQEARLRHHKAMQRLEKITMELESLRMESSPEPSNAQDIQSRVEQIQANFEALGIHADMAKLEEMADETDAAQALRGLRQRLQEGGEQSADNKTAAGISENGDKADKEDPTTQTNQISETPQSSAKEPKSEEVPDKHRDSGIATDNGSSDFSTFNFEPLGADNKDSGDRNKNTE